MSTRAVTALLAGVALAAAAGCGSSSSSSLPAGASAARGRMLIGYYGCGACHVIGGIATAQGHVGPPLTGFVRRYREIAGMLPNTPANVARWIMDPPRFLPRVDMPVLGVGRRAALDITAYLYRQ